MKTIKIILSTAGFVTSSFCFGQLVSLNDNEELYYTAYYDISTNRLEHHIDHFPARSETGDYFEIPLLSRTYFVPIEYDIPVEPWMTAAFDDDFYEPDIPVEPWMTEPFGDSFYEPDIPVEPWMTEPFGDSFYEPDIPVEPWMTKPFTLGGLDEEVMDEEIEVEAWMCKPWI